MQFTHEHREIQKTLKRFIDEQINPMWTNGRRPRCSRHTRCSRASAGSACWA